MSTLLDVRKLAAGIARRMGEPVEPCTYIKVVPECPDQEAGNARYDIMFTPPIERGPYVAFDGYFSLPEGETYDNGEIPVTMTAMNRPITYPHRNGQYSQSADYPNLWGGVGVNLQVLFPTLNPLLQPAGPLAINVENLDGWPAPVFLGGGDTLRIHRLTSSRDFVLALAGFHTSQRAWSAIAAQMGEMRAWVVGQGYLQGDVTPMPTHDEFAVPEPVVLYYAYATGKYVDSDVRSTFFLNKHLASVVNPLGVAYDPSKSELAIPRVSSPASVLGPKPFLVDETFSLRWVDNNQESGAVRNNFVGVARVNL